MLPNRKFYKLEFALENGERERCIVLTKDVPKVFPAAGFVLEMRNKSAFWKPFDPARKQPMVNLVLEFSPKFKSTRAVRAARTGEELFCDIRPPVPVGTDYEDF